MSTDSIESRLYDHVFGAASPHSSVLEKGILSDEWTETYLALLKEATQSHDGDSLPRDIVAAVHFASWYLNIRYDAWRKFGRDANEKTERNLARLRTPSEMLLLSGFYRRIKRPVNPI